MDKLVNITNSYFINEKPPILSFTLPGLLKGTVGSLVATGGCGKSIFAMKIAIQIACGRDFGIGESNRGKVLYLSGEDPKEIIHTRMYDYTKNLTEIEREDVIKNTFFLFKKDSTILNLKDSSFISELCKHAKDFELIIVDTLRRFHTEDENMSGPMSEIISKMEFVCRFTKSSILFLHHTNKNSMIIGSGDTQQATRGSSVIVDNTRWQGFLASMTKSEGDDFGLNRNEFVRFGISKINYGVKPGDVWFKRLENGDLVIHKIDYSDKTKNKNHSDKTQNKIQGYKKKF